MKTKFWIALLLCFLAVKALAQDPAPRNDASLSKQPVAETNSLSTNHSICPKCHSEMEEGLVPDNADTSLQHSCWLRKSLLKKPGMFVNCGNGNFGCNPIAVNHANWSQAIVISVFRCKSCGHLESYAK